MGQTLTIGGYTLDPDSAWFTVHSVGIMSQTGLMEKIRRSWAITGRLNGTSISNLNAKVVDFEQNHVIAGVDVVFSLAPGGGNSMQLLSSQCLNGTLIQSLTWLNGFDGVRGNGAEGIIRRTFQLNIYGDQLYTGQNAASPITAWHEKIQLLGTGGPRIVPVMSLNGAVQAQQIQALTPFYAIQSGFAVGRTTWPIPPTPIWQNTAGVYYYPDQVSFGKETPRKWGLANNGSQNTEFPVNWSYKCWASLQANLAGNPTFY